MKGKVHLSLVNSWCYITFAEIDNCLRRMNAIINKK